MYRTLMISLGLTLTGLLLQAAEPSAAPPPPRAIPGITASETQPRACVGCHVNMPDMGLDARLSTAMRRWVIEVEPALLTKAQAAIGDARKLEGRHPEVSESLTDVPGACLGCHERGSATAPPFSRLIHAIHFTGGETNHYLTLFQGECTHCHKLNAATGEWTIPSGAED